MPIAADESIRRAADPYRVRDLEAADIAVLKVQPLGGVRACLRIAEDIGLPVVVSSALETSVGIAAGRRAGGGAARAALRLRAGHRAAADRRRGDRAAAARSTGRCRSACRRSTRRALDRLAAAPERVAHWEARLAEVRALARAAGSALVNPSTDAGPRRRLRAGRGRRHARSCSPRARATRRCPSRRTTRRRPGCSGCTPGSTSAPPGFLALGLTRGGSRAAVVCTSGTAVANLHPAVLEAAHAGVGAGRGHRRPAGPAARHRRQPDHRPGRHLRRRWSPTRGRRRRRPSVVVGRTAWSTSTCSSTTRCCPTDPLDAARAVAARARPPRAVGSAAGDPSGCSPARARSWWPATTPARRRGCWPSGRAGRCWPSRPAARAPGENALRMLPAAARHRAGRPRRAGRGRSGTRRCPAR